MTQKEIWTGYWNTFCNMFAPVALFQAIASIFRRKKPEPVRKLHQEAAEEIARAHAEIKKILNEMLNEAKKAS